MRSHSETEIGLDVLNKFHPILDAPACVALMFYLQTSTAGNKFESLYFLNERASGHWWTLDNDSVCSNKAPKICTQIGLEIPFHFHYQFDSL